MNDFLQAVLLMLLIFGGVIVMFHQGVQGLEASQRRRVEDMIKKSKEEEEANLKNCGLYYMYH